MANSFSEAFHLNLIEALEILLKVSIIETIFSYHLWHQLYFGMMKFRTHFISTERGAFQKRQKEWICLYL